MVDDFLAGLQKDLKNIPTYAAMARRVDTELAKLVKKYQKISLQFDALEKQPSTTIKGDALEKTIAEAPKILWEQIRLAAKQAPEFNNKWFTDKLKLAALNEKAITIVRFKNGNIKVKINMNVAAGSLSDYGNAIKKIRQELGTRSGADIASHFWAEKFYGSAREGKPALVRRGRGEDRKQVDKSSKFAWKYWDIMRRRLAASGKVAPFWELLDKGTIPIPNAHRKAGAGTAYPVNDATDFTGKAQLAIKKFYESQSTNAKAEQKFDFKEAEKTLVKLESEMGILVQMLEELNNMALDAGANLVRQMGERIKQADNAKVQKLEVDLEQGVKIAGNRIRLGGGVRVRVARLQKLISQTRP